MAIVSDAAKAKFLTRSFAFSNDLALFDSYSCGVQLCMKKQQIYFLSNGKEGGLKNSLNSLSD